MQQASKYIDDDKITISPWLLGWLGPENVSCNKNNSVRDYQDWGVISKYPSIVKELEIFLYQPQYCKDHYDHSPDNQGSAVLPSKNTFSMHRTKIQSPLKEFELHWSLQTDMDEIKFNEFVLNLWFLVFWRFNL